MICVRFASDLRQMNHVLNPIYKEGMRRYYNNRKILTKKGTKRGVYY